MTVRNNILKQLTNQLNLARWPRSFWDSRGDKVGVRCKDLVSTAELLQNSQVTASRQLGTQHVPIEQIVGSGRWRDFDLFFQPKKKDLDDRWRRQAEARRRGLALKPVQLLKISDRYLVVDGNHRISVARALGQREITAEVMELDIENMRPEAKCQRLGFKIIPQTDR